MTETFYHILKKGGVMGLDDEACGETAVSVVLSRNDNNALCKLSGFKMLHQPTRETLMGTVATMLQAAEKTLDDVDCILTGISGNHANDKAYVEETRMLFGDKPLLRYKHLFGESFTASGLGFYVASQCLKTRKVPATLFVNPEEVSDRQPQCMVLYNRSDGKNVSLTLLEA